MVAAAKLAGFFAAHAIWRVSDGETLIPMFAYVTSDGTRNMARIAGEDLADAVEIGKQELDANEMDADDAVLIYDGRIPLGNEKIDAIILELRAYFSPDSRVLIAVPYTPKSSGKFLVHKLKLLGWQNCDDFDMDRTIQSFFEGVDEHEKGAAIWNESLDESK